MFILFFLTYKKDNKNLTPISNLSINTTTANKNMYYSRKSILANMCFKEKKRIEEWYWCLRVQGNVWWRAHQICIFLSFPCFPFSPSICSCWSSFSGSERKLILFIFERSGGERRGKIREKNIINLAQLLLPTCPSSIVDVWHVRGLGIQFVEIETVFLASYTLTRSYGWRAKNVCNPFFL